MKNIWMKYIWVLLVLGIASSCSKEYGYDFEDGVNKGADAPTADLDTNMSFVDRSLFNRARIFPGVVAATEPRLQDKVVELDLNYVPARDLRVSVSPYGIHSTGLYAATGELVKIIVPEGVDDLVIQIGVHTDNLTGKLNLQRDPIIYTMKSLFPGVNYIRSLYGGTIWIKSRTPVANPVRLTFSNVVESPDFVLGVTSNEEWLQKVTTSSVPWLEFRGKNVIYSVPRNYVIAFINRGKIQDPTKLMLAWDEVYEKDYYNWMGLTKGNPDHKHRAPDLPERGVVDIQISVGWGHNGYPWMGTISDEWIGTMVDISDMENGRGWGTWHEVGHNYQQGNWSWQGLGEVTNNLFIFKTQDRRWKETGRRVYPQHPNIALTFPQALAFAASTGAKDFDKEESPFWKLTPFLQLFNKTINPDAPQDGGWPLMAYIYTKTRNAKRISNNIQDRKDFFYEAVCEYTKTDYIRFMNAWGIYISPQSRRKIADRGYAKLTKEIWKYDPISNTGGDTPIQTKYDHPRAGWTVQEFSSNQPDEGAPRFVFDGNPDTYWHTGWGGNQGTRPFHITLNLNEQITIKGVYVQGRKPRANGIKDGRPRSVTVFAGNTLATLVEIGRFPLLDNDQRQDIPFDRQIDTRYLKFQYTEQSYANEDIMCIAELGAFYDD